MLELIAGNVPRGKDYFGREDFIESLWTRLRKDNILLAAPRRFGKTGAMLQLLDAPRAPYRPVYINVEDITAPADFTVELLAKLLRDHHFSRVLRSAWEGTKAFGGFLRGLPSSIDVGGLKIELREKTAVQEDWRSYGQQVMELLAHQDAPLLLLIDEFAVMAGFIQQFHGKDELTRFLHWFRSARLAPETRTRFVLGSSINLVSTLEGVGLVDTVNDLAVVGLKPFPAATAARFVEGVFSSRQVELPPEVEEAILDLVGAPIPYLLSVFLAAILERLRLPGVELSVELVQAVFEEDLLGGATAADLLHYRSRLDRYYTKTEARTARSLLGALSRSENGVEQGELYQRYLRVVGDAAGDEPTEGFLHLMNQLENDFYILRKDDRFYFFSRVLGAWWKARFGYLSE